jgi:hypothetical protein
MVQSLFNFNTYTLVLSSPPPLSSIVIPLSGAIQGVTRVQVDYNQLDFTVKPFKVILNWPNRPPVVINESFLPTLLPANSALSFTVIAPKSTNPILAPASILLYYENGIVHTFSILFVVNSDNIIDLDLDVLSVQNAYQEYGTIFNIQSNSRNTVFNLTDVVPDPKYIGNTPTDGYV